MSNDNGKAHDLTYNTVTRFEVIDHTPNGEGRAFVKYGIKELMVSLQDDNKTMKVFLK